MMTQILRYKHLLAIALLPLAGYAQGTVEDYRRAYSISTKWNGLVKNQVSRVHWLSDGQFTYDLDGVAKVMDAATGVVRDTIFAPREERPREFRPGQKPRKERHWMEVDDEKNGPAQKSPDGKLWAYIKEGNLHVCAADGKQDRALTDDGTLAAYYSSYIQWSPDGQYVALCRLVPPQTKRYAYYVESSPTSQLQPILHQQEYAKPGDELMQRTPTVVHVATGRTVRAQLPNQYDLSWLRWSEDSRSVTFEYNQRGHKLYQLLRLDAETGALTTLAEEKAETFVNYSRIWRQHLKGGKEILWTSERDNWNHIYLIDAVKGKTTQVTRGAWFVRRVVRVDEDKRQIYFAASGVFPDEDPYLIHYFRINFNGKNMVCLTPGNGNHRAEFSPDMAWVVDTWSRADLAPTTVLRSTSEPDRVVKVLGESNLDALQAAGWRGPEVFCASGRDGKTPMWGLIHRPTNFDPGKKYPVIEYIYSGPGDAYVPKDFRPFSWDMSPLAELGFIVVQLDGMGTSYRGKAFEEICYKNLKDAGLPDRIAWIKHAAERYPQLDTTRVGIFGCSAGGQESTTAVLWHPEFYKAAYSACGCHDNRMDKIWWNEQWMGYPVDSAYIECSNTEQAWRLQRPLMLVVGEMDDNVDPSSTMQLANALIKANKDFELIVIPGAHHTMGDRFGEHKRFDFFVRELLGVQPPKWADL